MLRGNWREALGWGSPRATACWIVAIAIIAALLLAAPGQTVSARYLNDLMMFLDGAHRIVSGQVPHRDFHTPMGADTNGLPAIGLWLTGSLGAAMPTGVACARRSARTRRSTTARARAIHPASTRSS